MKDIIICIISFLLIVISIIQMPLFKEPMCVEETINSPYAPSGTFQRITNSSYWNKRDHSKKIIRETSFYTQINDNQPGILVFDIDYKGENPFVEKEIWQQPVSWFDNQMFGTQYILEAIGKDGGLWSNKGIVLKRNPIGTLLSFPISFTSSQPLIVKHEGTLYIHDSDFFSSFLSNYQKNLLQELVGNTVRPNVIRGINILLLILIILSVLMPQRQVLIRSIIGIICISMVLMLCFLPCDGDIRMVGEIKNSHENNRFDGVPKTIVAAGYDYVIGNQNAKILIVQKNRYAKVKNEYLVLAEDNSTVSINGQMYHVSDVPIGDIEGVVDGRSWINQGVYYGSKIEVNGITLIATGSPALQSWKGLIK